MFPLSDSLEGNIANKVKVLTYSLTQSYDRPSQAPRPIRNRLRSEYKTVR